MASEKFRMKSRQISDSDRAAIQGIYSAMEDTAARYVQSIPLDSIKPFPGHPYHVLDNADMDELMESISGSGVQEPILVWAVSEPWQGPEGETLAAPGDYILISGHRRKHACQRLGLLTIPAILSTYTVDEARLAMVDANLRREKVLPSEKAYAYKIKYDALKNQGKRADATLGLIDPKLRASEKLAGTEKESEKTIRRLIRLTELLPELLEMVDSGLLPFYAAVSLSYLDPAVQKPGYAVPPAKDQKPNQALLLSLVSTEELLRPSMATAEALKEAAKNGSWLLSREEMTDILSSEQRARAASQNKSEKKIKKASKKIVKFLEPKDDEPLEFEISDYVPGSMSGPMKLTDPGEAPVPTANEIAGLKALLSAAARSLTHHRQKDDMPDEELIKILGRLEEALKQYREDKNICSI